MKTLGNIIAAMTTVAAISCTNQSGWSDTEKTLIMNGGATMRVLTVNDASDSLTLRKSCERINENELKSIEYQTLAEKMVATVTSPVRRHREINAIIEAELQERFDIRSFIAIFAQQTPPSKGQQEPTILDLYDPEFRAFLDSVLRDALKSNCSTAA